MGFIVMGMYCLAWLNANKLGISHFFIWIALMLFHHTDEKQIKKNSFMTFFSFLAFAL